MIVDETLARLMHPIAVRDDMRTTMCRGVACESSDPDTLHPFHPIAARTRDALAAAGEDAQEWRTQRKATDAAQ